jgi:adenosylhomocysteine nucleosidase
MLGILPGIGILGAMPEEVSGIIEAMSDRQTYELGQREYHEGYLENVPVVVAFSGWGKVASAISATLMAEKFRVERIWFTGIAGSVRPDVRVGDIVVASSLVHHDLDCRPLMERFEIPLLGMSRLPVDEVCSSIAESEALAWFSGPEWQSAEARQLQAGTGIGQPVVHRGMVASGDSFFNSSRQRSDLGEALPEALCVEMEGAAVAQAAWQFGIPVTVIRAISDSADGGSHHDYARFLSFFESRYPGAIIRAMLRRIARP